MEIQEHMPEIRNYQEDIRKTVEVPHLVFQSARDERSRIFYRLGIGRDEFAGKYLVVIVKYVHEASGRRRYIGTMYLSRSVYARGDRTMAKQEDRSPVTAVVWDHRRIY